MLEPAGKVFQAFRRRGQRETFSLQGLHKAEIVLLQDVRYESFGLPWDDWLTWGEDPATGGVMTVRLPRNHFRASVEYSGTAPLFATMADPFRFPASEAHATGRDVERENRQFRSRWDPTFFRNEIPAAMRDDTVPACPVCWSRWVLEEDDVAVVDFF